MLYNSMYKYIHCSPLDFRIQMRVQDKVSAGQNYNYKIFNQKLEYHAYSGVGLLFWNNNDNSIPLQERPEHRSSQGLGERVSLVVLGVDIYHL